MPQQQLQQGRVSKNLSVFFCINGLDTSTALEAQVPDTTPLGTNVRGFEPTTQRCRGGSRAGLSQYIAEALPLSYSSGSRAIQNITLVIDPTASAIGLSFPPLGGPSPPLVLSVPYVWFGGGSGYPPAAPPNLLVVSAKNESKTQGTTFSFSVADLTSSGLQAGDSITSATFSCAGAPSSAPIGTYPIAVTSAQISYGAGHTGPPYYIVYVPGKMTVRGAITYIQSQGLSNTSGNVWQASLLHPILAGDLIVVLSAGNNVSGGAASYATSVSDSQSGATYSQIQGVSTSNAQGSGYNNNYAYTMWRGFATAGVTGTLNLTIPFNSSAGGLSASMAVFRGATGLDGSAQNSGSGVTSVSWNTGSLTTSTPGNLLLVMAFTSNELQTPSSPGGFTADGTGLEAYLIGTSGSSSNPSGSYSYPSGPSQPTTATWGAIGASFHA